MFRFFGPPGTGKTTTLLNKVDELLAGGMSPTDIGYFSFTRKAAHEARDRAVARFNLAWILEGGKATGDGSIPNNLK